VLRRTSLDGQALKNGAIGREAVIEHESGRVFDREVHWKLSNTRGLSNGD
jgi:hypothetical protein